MNKNRHPHFWLMVVGGIFFLVWSFLALRMPLWGDEASHIETAKGLRMTGAPYVWSFDEGKLLSNQYTRGLLISQAVRYLYREDSSSLFVYRLVALIPTLLTFLTFAWYVRWRHRASVQLLLTGGILFFAQSFVLENSFYLRFYAALAWLTLVSLILLWEIPPFLAQKKYSRTAVLLGAAILVMAPMTLDHWQIQNLSILFLALCLRILFLTDFGKEWIALYRRWLLVGAMVLILTAPVATIGIDFLMSHLVIGNRVIGRSFVTYWDNLVGLLRFTWALNVCLAGFFFYQRRQARAWNFFEWLFVTGIISGYLTGLLTPHNHIFYGRFFYVPTVLAVLGFSGLLSELSSDFVRKQILLCYVILNLLLSGLNLYFDRGNIPRAISWLNAHWQEGDILLVFRGRLQLQGGARLAKAAYPILPTQDAQKVHDLIQFLNERPGREVYFLYDDEYEFRDRLFELTTGENRSPPSDLFRYLKDAIDGESFGEGLRACGIKRFDKEALIAGLQRLLREGFPLKYKGPEKRWWKKNLRHFSSNT